jgi:hypothetical protein
MDAFPQEGIQEAQRTSWGNTVRNKQQVRRLALLFRMCPSSEGLLVFLISIIRALSSANYRKVGTAPYLYLNYWLSFIRCSYSKQCAQRSH